jgi:hypothetical protein
MYIQCSKSTPSIVLPTAAARNVIDRDPTFPGNLSALSLSLFLSRFPTDSPSLPPCVCHTNLPNEGERFFFEDNFHLSSYAAGPGESPDPDASLCILEM